MIATRELAERVRFLVKGPSQIVIVDLRRSGLKVFVNPSSLIDHLYAGRDESESGWYPPWRGHYQTRNHLHFLLREDWSASGLWHWATKTAKHIGATVLYAPDRKAQRVKLRLRGVADGLLRRMGKTVEPTMDPPGSGPGRSGAE